MMILTRIKNKISFIYLAKILLKNMLPYFFSFHKQPEVTSEKLAIHLTQNTSNNHANKEVQIFMFILGTLVQLLRPLRVRISETPTSIWRMSFLQCIVCHSVITMVELKGVLRLNYGAGFRVSGPIRVLDFAAHA